MNTNDDIIMMPVPRSQFTAVCALLGGVALGAIAVSAKPQTIDKLPDAPAPQPEGEQVADVAPGTLDSAGWPWDASLHASTKGTTKEGLWRMKVGVSRPDPKPGFPKSDGTTGTTSNGAVSQSSGTAQSAPAGEDDDEFAAFRSAAANVAGTNAAAAAGVTARKWTDADLGALCNQAAVKFGDPAPVRETIAAYLPEGAVAHSRNIPDDQREAFASALETKAGITFAG